MDSATLVSFGLAVAVLVWMPGPATLYIVTRSLAATVSPAQK